MSGRKETMEERGSIERRKNRRKGAEKPHGETASPSVAWLRRHYISSFFWLLSPTFHQTGSPPSGNPDWIWGPCLRCSLLQILHSCSLLKLLAALFPLSLLMTESSPRILPGWLPHNSPQMSLNTFTLTKVPSNCDNVRIVSSHFICLITALTHVVLRNCIF